MTGPAPFGGQGFSIGSPSVVQAQPNFIRRQLIGQAPDYLNIVLGLLQHTAEVKRQQATTALGEIPEGTTYSALSPDQQKAVQRATGRKDFAPTEVVKPFTTPENYLFSRVRSIVPPGSPLDVAMATSFGVQKATGAAQPLQGPEAFASTSEANRLAAENTVTTNRLKGAVARDAESAYRKLQAGTASQNLTEGEVSAFRSVFDFVPSQALADQLGGAAKAKILQRGMDLITDPESSSLAPLLAPYGIKVGDAIAGSAVGLEQYITQAMQGLNTSLYARAQATDAATRANFAVAEAVAKSLNGAGGDASFILSVMRDDPKAVSTPKGLMVLRFLSTGFDAAVADMSAKGDPGMRHISSLIDLLRIPQIAGNDKAAASAANLVGQLWADEATKNAFSPLGIFARPDSGALQQQWDQYRQRVLDGMGGMFSAKGINLLVGRLGGYLQFGGQTAPGAEPAQPDPMKQFQDFLNAAGIGRGGQPGAPPDTTPPAFAQPPTPQKKGLFAIP